MIRFTPTNCARIFKNLCDRMPGKKSRKEVSKLMGREEGAMIAALEKKTSLSATEIKEQYKAFKKMCPQGQVNNRTMSIEH